MHAKYLASVLFIVLGVVCKLNPLYTQINQGLKAYANGHIYRAIDAFKSVDISQSADALIALADCYLRIGMADSTLFYLELVENTKSYQRNQNQYKTFIEVKASALFLLNRIQEAENLLKQTVNPSDIESSRRFADFASKARCAKKELAKPAKPIKVYPLSAPINTRYPDFAPVVDATESVLYFTTRRITQKQQAFWTDGLPFEDILLYPLQKQTGSFDETIPFVHNTPTHDATITLSPDGNRLLMLHGSNGGDLFLSEKLDGTWQKPVPLPQPLNSENWEPSACFSPDGQWLFIISDRPGGRGGRDLYLAKRGKNGKFDTPVNMGPTINTPYDEESPFLHPDGKTLFFSSKGHDSMGGFDVFKTVLQPNGTWSKPQNLSHPINSTADDLYFVLSPSGKRAYFTSTRVGGMGGRDIWVGEYQNDSLIETGKLTLLEGIVMDSLTNLPIAANLLLFDNLTGDTLQKTISDPSTGAFQLTLPGTATYGLEVTGHGYLFYSESFQLPDSIRFQRVNKQVKLQPIKKGSKITLNNLFFEFNESALNASSYAELKRLTIFMKKNPMLKVQISGHTDNTGTDAHNFTLSEARAKSVATYLINAGIAKERITWKGLGASKPIVPNNSPHNRQLNRRTELEIIE